MPILPPSQADDGQIKNREEDHPDGMAVCIAIELIGDEEGEEDDGGRIGPEATLEQGIDQDDLDDPVR